MHNKIKALGNTVQGVIYIAISSAVLKDKMLSIISSFKDKYPYVDLYINTYKSSVAVEKLMHDDVQLALVRGDYNVKCQKIKINSKPIILLSKKTVDLEKLPELPYIKYEADISLERDISKWWGDFYDVPPHTVMHLNNTNACRHMVASGLGYSILPVVADDELLDDSSKLHKLQLINKDGTPLSRASWILYKDYVDQLPAVQLFIDYVQKASLSDK